MLFQVHHDALLPLFFREKRFFLSCLLTDIQFFDDSDRVWFRLFKSLRHAMAHTLGSEDVQKLLADPSPHSRAEVAGKLAGELDARKLNESELELAQEIVRTMARDVAVVVRKALAENLKNAPDLPHDVALTLARDVEEVALPVLETSLVLTDADLVEIIDSGSSEKNAAIAARTTVSAAVSDAIVEKADETAVAKLVANKGAVIEDKSMSRVVDRFGDNPIVQQPLVQRDKLPVAVAERLLTRVSENLRDYLVTHQELSAKSAADMVLQSRERATVNIAARNTDEADVEKLVAQLYRNQRLTPSLVLRALCTGDITFFECALAILANVPLLNARILIHDEGGLGLKSIYEKSGLPQNFLPVVEAAIDVVHETEMADRNAYRATVIQRILTQCENLPEEDFDYLFSKLGDVMKPAA
jgi:uncharacterized protein (DUF2336 family)